MPRHTDPDSELRRLRTSEAGELHQYTTRLPTALAQKLVESAAVSGNQISREVNSLLSTYFACQSHGVAFTFDADQRRKLDLCCGAMGIDRESLVKLIIGENLPKYLQRAVDLQSESDAKVETLTSKPKSKR